MQIEQVQNLVNELDNATRFFDSASEPMRNEGLEREIVAGVNRLICDVLGVLASDESSLKNIDDVRMVARKLAGLIGIAGILKEDELLDDQLQVAMVERAERCLMEVIQIREGMREKVIEGGPKRKESVVEAPAGAAAESGPEDPSLDERIFEEIEWQRENNKPVSEALFRMLDENIGEPVRTGLLKKAMAAFRPNGVNGPEFTAIMTRLCGVCDRSNGDDGSYYEIVKSTGGDFRHPKKITSYTLVKKSKRPPEKKRR